MKKAFFASAIVALSVMAVPVAMAEQSVTLNGQTYTCTNQCVITVKGNHFSVSDSKGGRVTTTYNAPSNDP